jgi:hypothetical protein
MRGVANSDSEGDAPSDEVSRKGGESDGHQGRDSRVSEISTAPLQTQSPPQTTDVSSSGSGRASGNAYGRGAHGKRGRGRGGRSQWTNPLLKQPATAAASEPTGSPTVDAPKQRRMVPIQADIRQQARE